MLIWIVIVYTKKDTLRKIKLLNFNSNSAYMKKSVHDFYETFDFESMITNPPKLIQDFLDGEIQFIKKHFKPNKSILEVGCGYGRLLSILSNHATKVVGIDFSDRMIRFAKERLSCKKNVELRLMNAKKIMYSDEAFDYVVCLDNGFGNMPNIELNVLKEMTRTCKMSGEVIVSVFSDNASQVQIENYKRIGLRGIKNGKAILTDEGFYSRRFSKEELVELFDKCNLKCKIIKICPINYIAYAVKN